METSNDMKNHEQCISRVMLKPGFAVFSYYAKKTIAAQDSALQKHLDNRTKELPPP